MTPTQSGFFSPRRALEPKLPQRLRKCGGGLRPPKPRRRERPQSAVFVGLARCFRGSFRRVILLSCFNQRDAQLSRNLDQDADPNQDVEDREDLQPRIGDDEVSDSRDRSRPSRRRARSRRPGRPLRLDNDSGIRLRAGTLADGRRRLASVRQTPPCLWSLVPAGGLKFTLETPWAEDQDFGVRCALDAIENKCQLRQAKRS